MPMTSVHLLETALWAKGEEARAMAAVPALLRRRMSALTRITVATALDCCQKAGVSPSSVRTVFASRHGEMPVTVALLEQLATEEPVSPMDFAGSVHHTALGYFSLVAKNRQAMRAVAGGEASFCYGWMEALGMVQEDPRSPVLLVVADDQLPAPFASARHGNGGPYAAAFLIGPARQGQKGVVQMDFQSKMSGRDTSGPQAVVFHQWFRQGKGSLTLQQAGKAWQWQK